MATATVTGSTSTRGTWNHARGHAAAALTIAGLGCIDTGVFEANTVAGWIATGISVLVLEFRVDQ